jgi:diguanylate cyclase (GGDEF)-like protein
MNTSMNSVRSAEEKSDPAALVVTYGRELGQKYNLGKGSVIIGRSPKCDIRVDQELVSRSHAKIDTGGDGPQIRDLGSIHGTFVNDKLVDRQVQLSHGDVLQVGRTFFKFLSEANIESAYHEEIYRLTTVDGLTLLSTWRFFLERLDREISRAKRYGREFSLVLVSMDQHEEIGENYGFLACDFVLRELARLLHDNVRRDDYLARYRDQVLGVILPETGYANVKKMAEKVRKLVVEHDFRYNNLIIPATISVGIATYRHKKKQHTDLLQTAEHNLEKAGLLGNGVCG